MILLPPAILQAAPAQPTRRAMAIAAVRQAQRAMRKAETDTECERAWRRLRVARKHLASLG